MSLCTIINAHVTDQVIQLSNLPRIASGSKNALQIRCNFCGKWEGCGKTAVFYRTEDEVYHVPVVEGLVTVPWEVLVDEGYFWLGFMGEDDLTRTTEAIRIEVAKGALTVATATPQEPTPDIYQQIMAAYGTTERMLALEKARLDALVAVRTSDGVAEYRFEGNKFRAIITTNGIDAHLWLEAAELYSQTNEYYAGDFDIPLSVAPLGDVCSGDTDGTDLQLELHVVSVDADAGTAKVSVVFSQPTEIEQGAGGLFRTFYPVAYPSIAELADIRAGYNGENYDVAGDAVRATQEHVGNVIDQVNTNAADINDHHNRLIALEQNGGTGGGDLEERVDKVEATLYGATEPTPDPVVETVAVTNLLTNPQFADGETGWLWYNQYGLMTPATSIDADGLCLDIDWEVVDTFTYSLRQRATKEDFTVGHRYYMYARTKYDGVMPQNSVPTIGFFGVTAPALETTPPVATGWTSVSAIIDLPSMPSSSLYVGTMNNYKGHDADVDAVAETFIHFNNLMCIDLTAAFGAGNEPDLATMNRWVTEQYALGFDGTVELALTTEDDEPIVEATPGLVEKVATLETDVAGLKTEVADLAEAMENLPSAEVQQTGTVYPTLNEHFIANIEAAKPVYYGKQDANTLTFAMMADMHLLANNKTILPNVEASSAWAKLVNHDFVMMGGDFIIGDESKAASLGYIDTLMEMAEKHANCPVYAVKGNHDSCDGTDNKADRITAKEFYLHANARGEKHGMVIDPAHPYAGYYYVDFPRQKIRMVCLNTTEIKEGVDILTCDTSQLTWAGVKSTYQVEWVRDVALRVPDGWAVMMVSHIPPITGADLGVDDSSSTAAADTGAPFHKRGIKSPGIVALCKAFAEGTSGTANVTESGSVKIDYDFTEQGAREFIGHFCGHVHEDSLSVYNGLNYVVVNSTTPTKRWATSLDRTADADKLSLNSFIINRATRTVECIKIGASPAEDNAWWADSFTW